MESGNIRHLRELSPEQISLWNYTQELLEQQINMEKMIADRMDDFERKLKSSNSSRKPELDDLSRDFGLFKDSVMPILRLMHEQIAGLVKQVDEIDTQSRHNALLFTGIAEEGRRPH